MTDNDAAKALEALNSIELSSCEVWDQTVDIYDLVDKDTIETIRAQLAKSVKVDGLLEALREISTKGRWRYFEGQLINRADEAIQRFNGEV